MRGAPVMIETTRVRRLDAPEQLAGFGIQGEQAAIMSRRKYPPVGVGCASVDGENVKHLRRIMLPGLWIIIPQQLPGDAVDRVDRCVAAVK